MRSYAMATEAAAEILSQKLEVLLSHTSLLGRLSMETQAKAAKEKLAMIQEFLSTQDRSSQTSEWQEQLLRAMYDAVEFIDKFHLREACWRHKALPVVTIAALVSNYMLSRDLSNLVKDMKKLCTDQYLESEKETEGVRKREPASSSSHASDWQDTKLGRLTTFWDQQALTNFVRRETKKKEIMNRIAMREEEPGDVRRISILGEEGMGKTFLARWVYREAMYLGFDPCAWVAVSANMDMRDFLFEILKQVDKLAGDAKDMDLDEIADILYNNLAKRRKFLIVLDDVHRSNEQLLETLVMSIPLPTEGCIITTTRDDGVAEMMSQGGKPIKLEDLCQEEIRKMLASKLLRLPGAQSLTDEENKIIERCRGLPLYISLLGGLLSNAGESERIALTKDGSIMPLSDILQLSYHRLPIHLKPCFIYMTLFPRASPILIRRLVRLWLAEGLLDLHCYDRERKRTRLPEDVGETFILELANRSVIDVVSWRADGSPKACRILTSLYDMIRHAAMSTGFFHIHATSNSKDYNVTLRKIARVRWLAEHISIFTNGNGASYPDLNLDHISSFLSFYLRRGLLTEDISIFLKKLTSKTVYSLLRVLDLEGVYKPFLQGVLHKLVLLRYLGLRSTVLDSIPSEVADLHYLQTLDIKHTNITSLPSSLWKARNLRHLHLNWFHIDLKKIIKACGDHVMTLTKLQTLSGLIIGEVKENLTMGLMNSLTTLTTLKLFLQHSDNDTKGIAGKTVANWISLRLTNLQSLTFGVIQEAKPTEEAQSVEEATPAEEAEPTKKAEHTEGANKPTTTRIGPLPKLSLAKEHHHLLELYLLGQLNMPIWTELLPGSLRVLTLSGSKVVIDMMHELGGSLRNLRTFRLLANSFLGTSLTFTKGGFPSLMILKIWKLPQLEKVIIEQGAMQRLKELEFRHLERMKNVEGIKECKELETIWVVVKKGAHDFVDRLKRGLGNMVDLYVIEETETP